MKHISKETKASIINRYNNGESVVELTEATGVANCKIAKSPHTRYAATTKRPSSEW